MNKAYKDFDPIFNCARARECAHVDEYPCPCDHLAYIEKPKSHLLESIIVATIVVGIIKLVTGLVGVLWR